MLLVRPKRVLVVCFISSLFPMICLKSRILDAGSKQEELDHYYPLVKNKLQKQPTFYLLPLEELTTWLTGNYSQEATSYYERSLNEESAEIWIHRGLEKSEFRVTSEAEADVIIVCAYLHLNHMLSRKHRTMAMFPMIRDEWMQVLERRLAWDKPYVLAVPTWNPTVAQKIGVTKIMNLFQNLNLRYASLGFERNPFWQKTDPENILVVPYVVKTDLTKSALLSATSSRRTNNFVFYSGDERKHAVSWSGCNRTQLIGSLSGKIDNIDVQIRNESTRLPQSTYNERMLTSDYCLILCGDTPTSRSLASAIVHGCIPVHIGSRWWGKCEPPCQAASWGWSVTEPLSHIPYRDDKHQDFPFLDEHAFGLDSHGELERMLRAVSTSKKRELRKTLSEIQMGWLYGLGDPVSNYELGEATTFIWGSILRWYDQGMT